MGVITYYPMFYQIWMSFTDYGLANLRVGSPWPAFVGLSNYINILTNQLGLSYFNFWHILGFRPLLDVLQCDHPCLAGDFDRRRA